LSFSLLLGGARSGKSSLAVRMAQAAAAPVTFVATAEAGDEEMAARIAAHQAERQASWTTLEDPYLERVAALDPSEFLIVDCLTLWLSNVLERPADAIQDDAVRLAAFLSARPGQGVVVSNEVGWGIVPFDAATRRYRDLLGRVNAAFAASATRCLLVVAGKTLELESPDV